MVEGLLQAWDAVAADRPIPLLSRRMIVGEQAMVAQVLLEKGCHVKLHSHPSEQISCLLSGHVRWTLGPEGEEQEVEMRGGQVLRLPANFPHGVVALEDTLVLDVLSPPGAMGVDSQQG